MTNEDQVARIMIEQHIKECEHYRRDMNGHLARIHNAIRAHENWRLKVLLWIVGGLISSVLGLVMYLWISTHG